MYNSISGAQREIEFIGSFLKRSNNILEIDYEDTFDAEGNLRQAFGEKFARFYKRDSFVYQKPLYVKQTSNSLDTVIENLAEVRAALASTPFAWMV